MFDQDFKNAISELPSKEKDKLIFRLLKKDLALADRLYFELLDDRTVDDRRNEMETKILRKVEHASERYWSPGYLMMDMREISGDITEHVKITKDKFGEASLNLLMLNEILKQNSHRIEKATPAKAYKLCIYIIARVFKILMLIQKLHEDYLLDFKDNLKLLGNQIGNVHHLMKNSIYNGLDVNWLLSGEIPENIVQHHKELKANGYLK
ncbi:hypothetical protein KORDIASMS9_00692 [Kordia sp. SMS9]|uniref:hypothetical protein n=1 Tax=Kordia sp. SMS9 TaxID=2282170 RepID=UPI000E0D6CB9|nr:hypothetical protein [Kordia sp. SMS9]AXG68477.1 hypothetical protein KORDIASMS9_00692 [Kordia sp. SMS9]